MVSHTFPAKIETAYDFEKNNNLSMKPCRLMCVKPDQKLCETGENCVKPVLGLNIYLNRLYSNRFGVFLRFLDCVKSSAHSHWQKRELIHLHYDDSGDL